MHALKTHIKADSFGGLSRGDRFSIVDLDGGTFCSTVEHASYYKEDPAGSLLWAVKSDAGEAWDLFPSDLKDPSFTRLPSEAR